MPYRFSDEYSPADAGLIITGDSLEELFADAAIGMTEITADLVNIDESREMPVEIEADSLEQLFFDWLSEIVYLRDADGFLFKSCDLKIDIGKHAKLKGRLFGDSIDPGRHILKVDVKAVTLYRLKIEKINNHWRGEAVFDL